ncbi:hypothetical protein BC827DRAFT_1285157 [Russula dissimulans]|nr:hypothetical protein BC827DRAFT_1285157 [Russula dissimulans]
MDVNIPNDNEDERPTPPLSYSHVERTSHLVSTWHTTYAKERLCDSNPGARSAPRARAVTSALEELENNRHGMVVPVVERGLARLTGACGSEADEVELVKDYARNAEGKSVHGYARKKGGTCARGGEGASVEAIDEDGCGEEERDTSGGKVRSGVSCLGFTFTELQRPHQTTRAELVLDLYESERVKKSPPLNRPAISLARERMPSRFLPLSERFDFRRQESNDQCPLGVTFAMPTGMQRMLSPYSAFLEKLTSFSFLFFFFFKTHNDNSALQELRALVTPCTLDDKLPPLRVVPSRERVLVTASSAFLHKTFFHLYQLDRGKKVNKGQKGESFCLFS